MFVILFSIGCVLFSLRFRVIILRATVFNASSAECSKVVQTTHSLQALKRSCHVCSELRPERKDIMRYDHAGSDINGIREYCFLARCIKINKKNCFIGY